MGSNTREHRLDDSPTTTRDAIRTRANKIKGRIQEVGKAKVHPATAGLVNGPRDRQASALSIRVHSQRSLCDGFGADALHRDSEANPSALAA